MAQYDPRVIQKLADKLYSQANTIVFLATAAGFALGAICGYGAGHQQGNSSLYAWVGGIVLGAIGFAIGRSMSFSLRVKAQMALCQRQIEENTRGLHAGR
jgi:hypothetical protein